MIHLSVSEEMASGEGFLSEIYASEIIGAIQEMVSIFCWKWIWRTGFLQYYNDEKCFQEIFKKITYLKISS